MQNEAKEPETSSAVSGRVDLLVRRGRIKKGASIGHDMACGKWPGHRPRASAEKEALFDENMIFDVTEWNGKWWDCAADGFGYGIERTNPGEYGNGSVFVFDEDGVEFVDT